MTKPNPSSEPRVKQEGCCKLGISASSPFIPPTSLSTQQVPALAPAPPRRAGWPCLPGGAGEEEEEGG